MAWTSKRIPPGIKRGRPDAEHVTREREHNPQDDHGKDVTAIPTGRAQLKPGLPGTTKDYDGWNMPWRQ